MMNYMRQARERAGLTMLALSKATGVGENRLFQLERDRFPPHLSEAARLSVALGVPAAELFPDLITAPRVK